MFSNPYQIEKHNLIQDHKQFEKTLELYNQKQKLYFASKRYKTQAIEAAENQRENQKKFFFGWVIGKLQNKILIKKQDAFTRIETLKLDHAEKKITRSNQSLKIKQIAYNKLNKVLFCQNKQIMLAFQKLKYLSNKHNKIQFAMTKIQRNIKFKLLSNCFIQIKTFSFQSIIVDQTKTINTLKQQIKSHDKFLQQNVNYVDNTSQFTQQIKSKDQMLAQLRKQLQLQKQQSEQKIQELEDQMNRLNLQNIKLKSNTQQQPLFNETMTLNESQDLSFRILDELDNIPKKQNVETELSQKYLQKIIALKQTLSVVKEYIEESIQGKQNITKGQIGEVLKMLEDF